MQALLGFVIFGLALLVLACPVAALVALARTGRLMREMEETRAALGALERRLAAMAGRPSTARAAEASPAPSAAGAPIAASPTAPAATAVPAAPAMVAVPATRPGAGSREARPPAPREDFVSNLGPKLLVAAGGLAVVVFLGFFVRYAWENEWVGPTGRVLSAAVFSLGLLAGGLGLMRREYRPLGQGLAAAGLAGLYVTAFAAHTVYALVPRFAAAALMVFVTTCAVLLAERLDARLLAGLAWAGGYLAPILLSTGKDQAFSLFAYLALLGAGAVWLDRRRPWPETLPLALAGTAVLYAGWYIRFFRPERFEVAALGLVALTALLALGAAAKPRPAWMALVGFVAASGLAALAADADRPEIVLPLCLLLAGAALRASRSLGLVPALVAPLAIGLPLLYWAGAHYRPEAFGIAAAWLAAGSLLIALGTPESTQPAWLLPAVALIGGGLGAVGLAGGDRPLALLALLVAQAAIALLVARRFAWAEAVSAALAAVAVLVWHDRYFAAERAGDALALALTIAGVYFLITAARGLLFGERLAPAGVATHLVVAVLAWVETDRVLGVTAPRLLGPAAVALAAAHLVVGLASRARRDPLRARVTLALAASFLTIAIPVQLGLHGITLAWASEALVLLWLGVRQGSLLTRVFGYFVLVLAVARLLVRHLPLHPHAFSPVLNPELGVWLAVIASLAVAYVMTRQLARPLGWIDAPAGVLLVPLALGLLFAALTMETQAAFGQMAELAAAARDEAGALGADRLGDLSVSVLWTLFATSLLAAALGLRNRPLFYAGYLLFAVTAGKVVLLDLATLPTLYRMLSFLALGVLLLVGAWLNLRFRARLMAPEDAA
jgi:uncharacterized membrane protein